MMNEARVDQLTARLDGYNAQECLNFIGNVGRSPEPTAEQKARLTEAARLRLVEINAQQDIQPRHTPAERDVFQTLAAYEEHLRLKHGKRVRAQYIRRAIKTHGILPAIARAIAKDRTLGLNTLDEAGLLGHSFEAVAVRHPDEFDPRILRIASGKLGVFD